MIDEQLEFLIAQHADGNLPESARALVELRLKTDAEARAMLEEYRKLDATLKASMPLPAVNWERLADHLSEAVAHIFKAGGQRQDRHDLGSDGNVIAGTMFETGFILAQPHLDLAQEAVVYIDDAPPLDAIRVDVEAGKAAALLGSQFVGIGFVDAELF